MYTRRQREYLLFITRVIFLGLVLLHLFIVVLSLMAVTTGSTSTKLIGIALLVNLRGLLLFSTLLDGSLEMVLLELDGRLLSLCHCERMEGGGG